MAFLIDTNIAILARDGMPCVLQQLDAHDGAVVLSALSMAELQRGLRPEAPQAALRLARLEILLESLPVLPFDAAAARAYGRIIAQCGWVRGRDFDRMIAAHALAVAATLVTNNLRDFADIPGLSVQNWSSP